jgi:hypothetical protein
MRQVDGQVDAEHRRNAGGRAGLDEAHRAVDTIAIGEREQRLAVLGGAGHEVGWH